MFGRLLEWASTSKSDIYFVPTPENVSILSKCKTITNEQELPVLHTLSSDSVASSSQPIFSFPAKLAAWLPHAHFQNIFAAFFRRNLGLKLRRENLITSDGGTISLDWFDGHIGQDEKKSFPPGTPVIIICHGLTGGSQEAYCQLLMEHAFRVHNFRSVVFNYRGCANNPVTSPKGYCAADTTDLRLALATVKKTLADEQKEAGLSSETPVFGVGFSLGSIILSKYLSECGENNQDSGLRAAVSVSNPFNMILSSKQLNSGLNLHIYVKMLTKNLRNLAEKFFAAPGADSALSHISREETRNCKTIWEFDEAVTRKIFGYASVEDYYRDASTSFRVQHIKTNTMFINSLDDPFCDEKGIPFQEFLKNEKTIFVASRHGGHLSWWVPKVDSYADKAICEYLAANL